MWLQNWGYEGEDVKSTKGIKGTPVVYGKGLCGCLVGWHGSISLNHTVL